MISLKASLGSTESALGRLGMIDGSFLEMQVLYFSVFRRIDSRNAGQRFIDVRKFRLRKSRGLLKQYTSVIIAFLCAMFSEHSR